MGEYSTKEVATVLGVPESRVRSLVSAGWVQPSLGPEGEYRFSFGDLALLRSAQGLKEKVPARRIRRAIGALKHQVTAERPLSSFSLSSLGKAVVVKDGADRWVAESGQGLLPFEEPAARPIQRLQRPEAAEEWYGKAIEWEQTKATSAQEAYRRALAIDPTMVEAHINLGRLLHESGNLATAAQHYRFALQLRPDNAIAAFNLGVALQDLGRLREALDAYQRAVAADPNCADAHFNAANVCERLGERAAAIRHLKACRALRANG